MLRNYDKVSDYEHLNLLNCLKLLQKDHFLSFSMTFSGNHWYKITKMNLEYITALGHKVTLLLLYNIFNTGS